MPRQARFVLPGQPQHVIVRGNNRMAIFAADQDYQFYLEKLKQACEKHDCDVHAYVLMTNHVHLLITPHKENSLSKAMQMIGRYYVQYFNRVYQRSGTLWEGRYKSTLIDSETYLMTCSRYIELNPVRAEMVDHPSEYPWSSYRYNATGVSSDVVTPHAQYFALGSDECTRQAAYRALFKSHISEKSLEQIRQATNKSWVLGSEGFKVEIESQLNRRASPLPKGGDRKSKAYRENRDINRV